MRPSLAGLILLVAATLARADGDVSLRIESGGNAGELVLTPVVVAAHDTTLRYEMAARKEGRSGVSTTRQAGDLRLRGGVPKRAATLRLNVGPDDRYAVNVKLFDGTRVVADETIRRP